MNKVTIQAGNFTAERQENGQWKYQPIEKATTHHVPLQKGQVKYRDKPEISALDDFEKQYERQYTDILKDMTIEIANYLRGKL